MRKAKPCPKPSKAKKPKTKPRSWYLKEADRVFSLWIRNRDLPNGNGYCFACGAYVKFSEAHNMHFITRQCFPLRFDPTNCHAGCVRCNIFLNGNYIQYTREMIRKYGIKKVDELMGQRWEVEKWGKPELQAVIDKYQTKSKGYMASKSRKMTKAEIAASEADDMIRADAESEEWNAQ